MFPLTRRAAVCYRQEQQRRLWSHDRTGLDSDNFATKGFRSTADRKSTHNTETHFGSGLTNSSLTSWVTFQWAPTTREHRQQQRESDWLFGREAYDLYGRLWTDVMSPRSHATYTCSGKKGWQTANQPWACPWVVLLLVLVRSHQLVDRQRGDAFNAADLPDRARHGANTFNPQE